MHAKTILVSEQRIDLTEKGNVYFDDYSVLECIPVNQFWEKRRNFSRSLMAVSAQESVSFVFRYYIDQRFLSSFILRPSVKLNQRLSPGSKEFGDRLLKLP